MGQNAEAWVCQNCKFAMQKEAFIGKLMRLMGKGAAQIASWIVEGAVGAFAGVNEVLWGKLENFCERLKQISAGHLPPKESRKLADEGQEILAQLPEGAQERFVKLMKAAKLQS